MIEVQAIPHQKPCKQVNDSEWQHFDLDNFELCMATFEDARLDGLPRAIDGRTGSGKTYAAMHFQGQFPQSVVLITCAGDLSPKGFIRELALALKLNPEGTAYALRYRITRALYATDRPVLIVDEAENLKDPAWQSLKAMMDALIGVCGIVVIGANELEASMLKKANRLKNPFPQVYSRLKLGGITPLLGLHRREVKSICTSTGIEDQQVIRYLTNICGNMRELEGAIRKLRRESCADNCEIDMQLVLEVL